MLHVLNLSSSHTLRSSEVCRQNEFVNNCFSYLLTDRQTDGRAGGRVLTSDNQ